MTELSKDAIVFGFGYLLHQKALLSFGGEGAQMRITPRARAALQELLDAGYAVPREPDSSEKGREYYRGTDKQPHLGALAQGIGLNPFDMRDGWATFERIPEGE